MNASGTLRAVLAAAVLVSLVDAGTACADGPASVTPASVTTVRSSSTGKSGRITIDTSGKAGYTLDQDGDHVVVQLTDSAPLAEPPTLPHNAVSLITDGLTLDLVLEHGVRLRPSRSGGRIILDLSDAADTPPSQGASNTAHPPRPGPPLSMALSPELGGRSTVAEAAPVETALPLVKPAEPKPPPVAPNKQTAGPETQQASRDAMPVDGPVALRARRTRLPKEIDGTAFLVPFSNTTAAAQFDVGDTTYVVFDERRPVDMAALTADPVFAAASVRLLPAGTLLSLPHAVALSIALTQLQQGWRIAALNGTPKRETIVAAVVDGRLNLAAEQPGDVVTMADPDTGATLLVGTQHRPGQGVSSGRHSAEFILRPTAQGVVVEPLSDVITLKQIPTGFSLMGSAAGLALSPPSRANALLLDAAHLTRRLNFSTMPADALMRLASKQLDEAAASPPLARGPRHRAAAETMMSLGLSAEAEGLLHMASDQDPKEAASADTEALTAIAALLAGRSDEAAALSDVKLDGTDEINFWRAVRLAMQDEGSPRAAAVFATTAPLVFQYPKPIRDHVLPLIADTMIQGGEIEPAAHLLSQVKDDPLLGYARALLVQAEGDSTQALTLLDALANGHNQFDRARAAARAVELRLAMGTLDKSQAADALDKLLYAWRGDTRELALRERVAQLRGQVGAWRVALAMLRQAEVDFPDQAAPIRDRLKDAFAAMIRDQATTTMPPIDFVAMVDENTDLMPDAGDDEAVEQLLADRLLDLDLPGRAKAVLSKLMAQAKSAASKARFGATLAKLSAREGDDAAALAALKASQSEDLPADLTEQRLIGQAESMARLGDQAGAAAILDRVHTTRTAESRAQILEAAEDWAGAEKAWADCAGLSVPASGTLDEGQARIVLRLATATARAGDEAKLGGLRDLYGQRIATGPLGDMFRLLTAEPIHSLADIGRSQREVSLAASLPADLKALRGASATR
jgi:hypothetical protein